MPSALKHGAFSTISFLPGEDPAEFEKLRQDLAIEYQISGSSEEAIIDGITKTFWQARRKDLYLGFQIERARQKVGALQLRPPEVSEPAAEGGDREGYAASAPAIRDTDHPLEEIAPMATLDLLSQEVDLDMKLQAKLDRQFRMLFQIKASKSIDIVPASQLPEIASPQIQQLTTPNKEQEGSKAEE